MALWLAATIAHFGLTVFWIRAFGERRVDQEDLVFHSAVIGLGSLQAVLHAVAFSVGLSLGRGLAGLAIGHLVVAAVLAIHRRRSRGVPADPGEPPPTATIETRALSAAGGIVLAALAVQWAIASASSLRVTGADAAHYHAPHAVNIALGANPFGLPATPHLYPMGTSVLAAWFILPVDGPLLIDLANLLPFLLAWCAILRLVRETTGWSGLAWGPWCAVAMFSAPLFRHSLLMSADLFYTAAFLAMNALLLKASARLHLDRLDAVSIGLAAGMLVSTKVTGVFSLAVLGGTYGAVAAVRMRLERKRFARNRVSVPVVGGALLLALAAGGVWLIRNWWNYGSPIAPSGLHLIGIEVFPGEEYGAAKYYLSVLKDVRDVQDYSLTSRTWHWVGVWLGAWFPVSSLLAAVPIAGAWVAWARRRALDEALRARLIFATGSAVVIGVHLALLAGVPWSSLEWTLGFSLRYALPCAALLWLVGYTSVLPLLVAPGQLRLGVGVATVLVSVAWYIGHKGVPDAPTEEALAQLTIPAALLGLTVWVLGGAAARLPRTSLRATAGVLLIAGVVTTFEARTVRLDAQLTRSAQAELDRRVSCATCDGVEVSDSRGTYLGLLNDERAREVRCSGRRLFMTSRWDYPLDLQSARFENLLFDVRGPSLTPRLVERTRPGTRPCDYVIAARSALDTTNGVPLVNRLNAEGRLRLAAEAGRYVVFAAR